MVNDYPEIQKLNQAAIYHFNTFFAGNGKINPHIGQTDS